MCAIIGALLNEIDSPERAKRAEGILASIMEKSIARGRDGYGWSLTYDMQDKLTDSFKTVESYTETSLQKPILLDLGQTVYNGTIIGNFRAEPTTEYVLNKRKQDQQPYKEITWSIVHNGTIANDTALRTYKLDTTIDSAAIAESLGVQGHLFDDADAAYSTFATTVRAIKGSYAILATNEQYTNEIFVAANYRPVWYAITDVGVFFASSKDYFPNDLTPIPLEPYTINRFAYNDFTFSLVTESLQQVDASKKPKALVIASGGLDSTVAASVCIKEGYDVSLLHFEYGCRAEDKEYNAIKDVATALGVELKVFPLDIYNPKDSRLFDKNSNIAGGEEGAEFAHEWVPARNLVMLSVATAYAEANAFEYIVLGNNMEEAGAYPDNEPEFIRRFNEVLPFAVGDGKRVRVLMPVGDLMKHEIVALGHAVGAPMDKTWSCYKEGLQHCGKCGPCFMRKTAFQINKLNEVISYED